MKRPHILDIYYRSQGNTYSFANQLEHGTEIQQRLLPYVTGNYQKKLMTLQRTQQTTLPHATHRPVTKKIEHPTILPNYNKNKILSEVKNSSDFSGPTNKNIFSICIKHHHVTRTHENFSLLSFTDFLLALKLWLAFLQELICTYLCRIPTVPNLQFQPQSQFHPHLLVKSLLFDFLDSLHILLLPKTEGRLHSQVPPLCRMGRGLSIYVRRIPTNTQLPISGF